MRKFKSFNEIIFTNDFQPKGLPQRAILVQRFIDDVPSANAPLVMAHNGMDMVAHALQKNIPTREFAIFVVEHPLRRLVMPNKGMPHDEHAVGLAERHIAVSGCKIVCLRFRMDGLPFESVFGSDAVEMGADNPRATSITFAELVFIQCRPDKEVATERVFQSRWFFRAQVTCAAGDEDGKQKNCGKCRRLRY